MTFWTYQNLADLTQGTWLVKPDDLTAELTGLWHDTRDLKPGQAYLAIKGENFDGHDFLPQAFDAGAKLAIIQADHQSSIFNHQFSILKVDDTVKALQDLAHAYRDELKASGCKVIGIAGSNGKTTTRHLIHHVLTHAGLTGTQSPKSFNNHLGVPLTLLSGKPQDDFVACEIGTNHPGEIDFLSEIARPDIAVITSIGEEHLEFFKDLEGVAKEESCIIAHVLEDGVAVMDEDSLEAITPHLDWSNTPEIKTLECFGGDFMPAWNPLAGPFLGHNMALAGEVAARFKLDTESIRKALQSVKPVSGRMERLTFGSKVSVINDAYNANPSSMRDTIEWFGTIQLEGRKVVVAGDMMELGEASPEAHRSLGGWISVHEDLSPVVCVGPECCRYVQSGAGYAPFPSILIEQLNEQEIERISALLQPGDTVLLKASRGMRLERLIPAIERRFGAAQDDEPK